MPNSKTITAGTRFTRLVVIEQSSPLIIRSTGCRIKRCLCMCDCGETAIVRDVCLRNGTTQSCGCLRRERTSLTYKTHGHTAEKQTTRTYHAWATMKKRCSNPACKKFPRYGGRGIKVCEQWQNSFQTFLSDMGECPPGLSIDRVNNDGNYEPGNCRWATRKEQARNTNSNRRIEFQSQTLCLSEWAERTALKPITILMRLKRGWTVERTLTTPSLSPAQSKS